MSDRDFTPNPGRPSARGQGRNVVPEGGGREEGADPPTVRSGLPQGSDSAGSADRRGQVKREGLPGLPVPGQRVGDFGLEEAIGAGGMGAVFRAIDIKLDRQVALKILPPDQAIDFDVVQRYYQEGRAAARLDHENIARVYSIGHDGVYHFICFEFIEGTTIRQRVERDGPLAVEDAINYTLQIANALVHASERGVVHRDIKPSNIIVTPHGRAKLVDMGLARRFERGEDTGLTQSGMTLGTFDYISPEQARDPRDVDVRGDLYSLGCTLFHMLSGRPPFPEGTVLQKLIQHQEEPVPDIRKQNPQVPDDLAAILVKLMAKDRDRRYQTAELLVRDLLTVAGALGLRSLNPEGLVWMAPKPVPAWTKHVVWAVPAVAFLVVMGLLAWWGDGPTPVAETSPPLARPPIRTVETKPGPTPRTPPTEEIAAAPVEQSVSARDDLVELILDSPPKSTFVLSEKGPYDLRGLRAGEGKRLEFTIKAESGVRPVIRLPRDPGATAQVAALLELVGGRATLEGLEFVVDGADALAAIQAEGTDLVVRRCSFRRLGNSERSLGASAISLKASSRGTSPVLGERSVLLSVDASEFDGGQAAIHAEGAVDVWIRDCTIGPASASLANFWFENKDARSTSGEVRMSHVSVLAGAGSVFRIEGASPRIHVADSVFAPPTVNSPPPTLVTMDAPERLDWHGINNLYGPFRAFGQRGSKFGQKSTIATFAAWVEDPSAFRESGSTAVEGSVWDDRNPLESLAMGGSGATRAFRLALTRPSLVNLGARYGPAGPLPPPVLTASLAPTSPTETSPPTKVVELPTPASTRSEVTTSEPGEMREIRVNPPTEKSPVVTKNEEADAPTGMNDPTNPLSVDPEHPNPPVSPMPTVVVTPKSEGLPASVLAPGEAGVIRTVEEFREAMNRPAPGVKTLVIASDADWVVPAFRVRGMGTLVIRAERGAGRPRLRFRGEGATGLGAILPAIAAAFPDSMISWITLQSGGLRLEGIDLVLPETEKPNRKRAAFAVAAGSNDLSLTDCTVTIEGDAAASAVVALLPGEPIGEVRLRFKDCTLRSGGDLVDVASRTRLDLDIDDAMITLGGTLLHVHGSPEGKAGDPIKMGLRKVTARMIGGLAHLQSTSTEPELPIAEIKVRDSIFATGSPDTPLLRVDGQGDIDDLRPLIRWEGRSVAYHQLNIYRRDQSAQPGAVPTVYNRDFWNFKLSRLEDSPIHGDLKFQNPEVLSRLPWTFRPEDLRLAPESPAIGMGFDPLHIPVPPTR